VSDGTVILGAEDASIVPAADEAQLLVRLDDLAREVRQLRARVSALERLVGNAGEHPTDKAVVREKAVYDWQG
jgi:hypothetical protein